MILDLPRFEDDEIPSAAKLNSAMVAIETKFNSVTANDIAWPLVAQGNIDFAGLYGIVNLRSLWNIINVREYPSVSAAVSAAVSAGGGCLLVPPGYSSVLTCDGITLGSSDIMFLGCGHDSVITLTTAAASGYMFQSDTNGRSNIGFVNLTLDGASQGTNQRGLLMQGVSRFFMVNVIMKNFTGSCLHVTNTGAAGSSCVDGTIDTCVFSGGTTSHITGDDVNGLRIVNTEFDAPGATSVNLEPVSTSHNMRRVQVADSHFKTVTGIGCRIVGSGAAPIDAHSRVKVVNCLVDGSTSHGVVLGETSKLLKHASVKSCDIFASGDAIDMNASGGMISGNYAPSAGAKGVDLVSSVDVSVVSNHLLSATTTGIDADGTTNCSIRDNDVTGAGSTPAILRTNTTGLRLGINYGDHAGTPGRIYHDPAQYTRTTNGDYGFTYTIRGGTVRAGDHITVRTMFNKTGTVENASVLLKIGGVSVASTQTVPSSPAAKYAVQWDIQANALSGDTDTHVALTGNPVSYSGDTNGSAINWAVDQVLLLTLTISGPSNSVAVQHTSVFIDGAK